MLHAHPPEWQFNPEGNFRISDAAIHSSLSSKTASGEQLLIQSLLQQCDGGEVGNVSPLNNSENSAVGNATSQLAQRAVTDLLLLQFLNQRIREQSGVLSRDVSGEVSSQPVNAVTSDLSRPDSFSLSHGSTVNHVDRRPTVPHRLVGAPANRGKISDQDACQFPPLRYYTGLYIDQSSQLARTETMATTKPVQGILLKDAVEAVLEHWKETGALKEKSLQKFTSLLRRYASFATNLGADTLAQQSEELAAQWIKSKGRNRSKAIVLPADSTMNTRRSALRKFFRDAEEMKLSDSGLVVKAYVAPRPKGLARPLTDEEARKVWTYAKDAGPHTRRPAIFALLLSGVHSSEVGLITVNDVDIPNQRVWAHGDTSRIKPRWVKLDEPYFGAIIERIDYLRDWMPPHRTLATFQLTQGTSVQPRGYSQNRAAAACKEVFRMLGLHNVPDITPSSVSLHAGARMLRAGERIETITKVLGYASLDSCAKALCFDWETGEIA